MADQTSDEAPAAPFPTPSLEDIQHWTWVMGRAQQLMMEHLAGQMGEANLCYDPKLKACAASGSRICPRVSRR